MKVLYYSILLVLLPLLSVAQCPAGSVNLITQADVDAFVSAYPNCTTVSGNFCLGDCDSQWWDNPSDIVDVTGLSNIMMINGRLTLANLDALTDATGLDNIQSVNGHIAILGNVLWEDLSFLSNLNGPLNGGFSIYNNDNLLSFSGLNGVTSCVNEIWIDGNTSLTSLNGLENITSARYIILQNNPVLTDVNGFSGLQTLMEGGLRVVSNVSISNLDGFANLTAINGDLSISNNTGLTDISGLSLINPQSIDTPYGIPDLTIYNNPNLSECSINNLCTLLDIPGRTFNISLNGSGCDGLEELAFNCECAFDTDSDGVPDCIDPCVNDPNTIVGNMSFESGFLGWEIPANAGNFSIDTSVENVLHGSSSLYITAPNATVFENHAIQSESFVLQPDVGYNIRIPVKRIGAADGDAFRWVLIDGDGVYRHFNNYYNIDEDWTYITISGLMVNLEFFPNNMFHLRLEFGLSATDIVVDKIEIYKSELLGDPAYVDTDGNGIPDCTDVLHPDYTALEAFYNSTNGASWNDNTNWLSEQPLSTWYGITLNGNNRVKEINLYNNNLSGSLPNDINGLPDLEILNLPFNDLTGNLPTSIGELAQLKTLWLYQNNLDGEVPAQLGNLSNLEFLDFANNDFSGELPNSLSNLTTLKRMSFASNNLTGTIPSGFQNLSNIEFLNLGLNNLTGQLPDYLGNLSNLKTIYLGYNQFEGNIPASLGNLTNLESLSLAFNQLNGQLPQSLSNLLLLKYLNINNNRFNGPIPDFTQSLITSDPYGQLNLKENYFNFSDIEPFHNDYLLAYDYQFSPQLTTDFPESVVIAPGEDVVFTVEDENIGRTAQNSTINNVFQWFKDGQSIAGAEANTYTIENAQIEDSGIYHCEITNNLVTGLIIRRANIELNVDINLSNSITTPNVFIIAPNPTTGIITIENSNNISIEKFLVFDTLGKKLMESTLNGNTINLSALQSGLYFIQLESEHQSITKRIIKQ